MKVLLIGAVDAGKTSLIQRLTQDKIWESKTGCVVYGEWVDTPGELFENQAFFRRLLQLSNQADLVLWVEDATRVQMGKQLEYRKLINTTVLGIATKIDQEHADLIMVSKRMQELNIWRWYPISNETAEGVAALQDALVEWDHMLNTQKA
jgi:ethanolamine utilization protein EutP